jgi:hypothetical protein
LAAHSFSAVDATFNRGTTLACNPPRRSDPAAANWSIIMSAYGAEALVFSPAFAGILSR